MKKVTYPIFFSVLLLTIQLAFAQQYCFRNFSINDGLPQSNVFCMIQDNRGFLWMGTEGGGLCYFDGITFKTYTKRDGISGNIIRSLLQDKNGNIWIGTENGINVYDGYEFFQIGTEQGFTGSTVLDIFEDSKSNIWAATNDAGVYKINLSDSITIQNISVSEGLTSYFIWDIAEDEWGRIWLAMLGGINIIESSDEIKIHSLDKGYEIPSDHILDLEFGSDNNVYAGTYGDGVFIIKNNEDLNKIKSENTFNSKLKTENTIVWDILSNKNEVWFATSDNGVIYYDGNSFQNFTTSNGLSHNMVLDILIDKEENVWFATMGSGADMFLGKTFIHYNELTNFPFKQVLAIKYHDNQLYLGTDEGLKIYSIENENLRLQREYITKEHVKTIDFDAENNIWAGTLNGVMKISSGKVEIFDKNRGIYNNHINCLLVDNKNIKWIGTNDGYNKLFEDNLVGMNEEDGFIDNEIQTIIQDRNERIWMGTLGGLVLLDDKMYSDFNEEDGLLDLKIHALAEDRKGNIWIGTFGSGIFKYNIEYDSIPIQFVIDNETITSNNIYSLLFYDDTTLLVGTDKGFDLVQLSTNLEIRNVISYGSYEGFYGVENNLNAIEKDNLGNVWFGTFNDLTKYKFKAKPEIISPLIHIEDIKLFYNEVDWKEHSNQIARWTQLPQKLLLPYNENHLTFDFTAIYNTNPKNLKFTYILEGQSNTWSPLTKNRSLVFSGLTPGNYNLIIKPITNYGIQGNLFSYQFRIEPPFWQKTWFIISCILLLIIIIILIFRYRTRKLRLEKIKLEKIVLERTQEVRHQKDEIQKQRDEIKIQNDIVVAQKQEITDSIHYAQRIQKAVLPQKELLNDAFNEHFILFRPKDIVSGDFYWMTQKNEYIIVAAADCTGHGVPGAFMSMLGVSFLNRIVNELGVVQPGQILNHLRENIIQALKQKGFTGESKDGMDIAMCVYNPKENKLQFAGANNPLLLLRKVNGAFELREFKGDRMPVAIHMEMSDFQSHEIEIKPDDRLFMFSDGYVDQFGGPKGRKFMKKNFKNLLLDNQDKSMEEQLIHYKKVLKDWINYSEDKCKKHEQIDDILVIGLKI